MTSYECKPGKNVCVFLSATAVATNGKATTAAAWPWLQCGAYLMKFKWCMNNQHLQIPFTHDGPHSFRHSEGGNNISELVETFFFFMAHLSIQTLALQIKCVCRQTGFPSASFLPSSLSSSSVWTPSSPRQRWQKEEREAMETSVKGSGGS